MEDEFKVILREMNKKSGRSRLGPCSELIDELRCRGLTYRDISDILTDELQVHVPKSTVNDFVRERFRRRTNAARRISRSVTKPAPIVQEFATVRRGRDPAKTRSGRKLQH